MKKTTTVLVLAFTAALSACGQDPAAPAASKNEETAPPAISVDKEYVDASGRWSTVNGALPDNRRIVIDIASNGRFTMDVRAPGKNGEAIVEGAKGDTEKRGSQIIGTVEPGPGARDTIDAYSTWHLDIEEGSISGTTGSSVSIAKE